MTKMVTENVKVLQECKISKLYICICLAATYITLNRDTVKKEAIYSGMCTKVFNQCGYRITSITN